MEKIKKGDEVIVLSGRDKGRRGLVTSRTSATHVLVDGINMAKRHTKPNPQKNQPGGVLDKNLPIHLSKVALFNPVSQKADWAKFRKVGESGLRRFFASNDEQIDKS